MLKHRQQPTDTQIEAARALQYVCNEWRNTLQHQAENLSLTIHDRAALKNIIIASQQTDQAWPLTH